MFFVYALINLPLILIRGITEVMVVYMVKQYLRKNIKPKKYYDTNGYVAIKGQITLPSKRVLGTKVGIQGLNILDYATENFSFGYIRYNETNGPKTLTVYYKGNYLLANPDMVKRSILHTCNTSIFYPFEYKIGFYDAHYNKENGEFYLLSIKGLRDLVYPAIVTSYIYGKLGLNKLDPDDVELVCKLAIGLGIEPKLLLKYYLTSVTCIGNILLPHWQYLRRHYSLSADIVSEIISNV